MKPLLHRLLSWALDIDGSDDPATLRGKVRLSTSFGVVIVVGVGIAVREYVRARGKWPRERADWRRHG